MLSTRSVKISYTVLGVSEALKLSNCDRDLISNRSKNYFELRQIVLLLLLFFVLPYKLYYLWTTYKLWEGKGKSKLTANKDPRSKSKSRYDIIVLLVFWKK